MQSCLEQLSGVERFTHQLLDVAPGQKRHGHHSHEHPGEHEAEAHATERNTLQEEIRGLPAVGTNLHGSKEFDVPQLLWNACWNSYGVGAVSEFRLSNQLHAEWQDSQPIRTETVSRLFLTITNNLQQHSTTLHPGADKWKFCAHAISRFPPVLDTQPREVGEVCLSNPRIPHKRPRKLKAKISATMQHSVMHPIHLQAKDYTIF